MLIEKNFSLKNHNTFGIDVKAKAFVSVESLEDLKAALNTSSYENKFILGGGSNMLLTKNVDALVIHINLKGKEVVNQTKDEVHVKAYAGENWHEFVVWCIEQNFGGIENLSLIPGSVGATPIQNIGAYGVEIKDVFISCDALNVKTGNIKTFFNEECQFGYRESVFKQDLKNLYIILSVTFKLTFKNHHIKTNYGAITTELERFNIENPTIKDVSKAVIAIRESKLPNPKEIGNSGSFFKNPIIKKSHYLKLLENFPEIPHYAVSESEVKVPAGWLIEHAGFKGKTFKNYGVHNKQALVLVNYGDASGNDILNLANLIQHTINRLFGIQIEMEVNVF
ncbi:UDP-N-acetylmuramate dehydrogenase [Paucihalobacter sp.]|uniref:UDP-N-acetylmuramate dehydrogenase n=1 Tax=Paucihalobacter sp. TaxID=2850405 RepID=UPI002FE286DA